MTATIAPPVLAAPMARNAGAWFSTDDYPAEALRRNEAGRTVAVVSVSAKGRPTACTIRTSSGSRSLDRQTCSIVMARGSYRPAHDDQGRAVAGMAPLSIRWVIPTDALPRGYDPGTPAGPLPSPKPVHHSHAWYWFVYEAHHLIALVAAAFAFTTRKVRRWVFGDVVADDPFMKRDAAPPRRVRRETRWMREALVLAPIVLVALLLSWLQG